MKEIKNIDVEELISRFIEGTNTQEDKYLLHEYIEHSHKDELLNSLLLKHWEALERKDIRIDEDRLNALKQQLQKRILSENSEKNSGVSIPLYNWKTLFTRVAAILAIPLLIASVFISYYVGKQSVNKGGGEALVQEIVSSPGSRVHCKLPDQTDVWLNSGSKLEFPLTLAKNDQRRVKLIGQGYFQVAHDAKHPFFVETNSFTVKVLGTSFDVSSYEDDRNFSSTLEKGSISILNKNNKEIGRLIPGEMAVVEKVNEQMSIEKIETELVTSWKDGKLIFRNTPLDEVTKRMERWFNCQIDVDPKLEASGISYTGTIQQETIEEVLKMIEISTHVKTRIENRNVKIWK